MRGKGHKFGVFLTTPIRPSLERLQDAKKKKDPKEPAATKAWLNVSARGAQMVFLLLKKTPGTC